jgi:hypothetical protein
MELAGDMTNPNDQRRLDGWRKLYDPVHFREDAALPSNRFVTAGNILFMASDAYKWCFLCRTCDGTGKTKKSPICPTCVGAGKVTPP